MNPILIQIIILSLWLGASAFLSAVVAPALFSVLPSRTLAGAVVGLTLPVVFYAGMLVGGIVAGLQVVARGAWVWGAREISGLAIMIACAVAQFVVAPRIARVRDEIAGPIESLPLDDARRIAFGRLHGISVAWLGVAMIAAAVAVIVAVRAANAQRIR